MLSCVNDLKEMEQTTHAQVFGTAKDAKIDLSQIVVCGHSFGGITALRTAAKLGDDCKACCVMDPWFYAYHEDFTSGAFKLTNCPVQIINSEMFHPSIREFKSWEVLKAFLNNSHPDQENITVRRNGHLN